MSVKKWGESRQYNKNTSRHQLSEVVPLAAPYLVHVDPTNLCNFQCEFCPTGLPNLLDEVKRPAGRMDYELFEKIMQDMQEFPVKPKVLHLYKDGEPLLHPQFGRMAKAARFGEVAEKINLTTNASALTDRKAQEILDAEIDLVRVSIEHVTDEGYKEVTKTFSRYQKIIDNVANLYKERNKRGGKTQIWVKILQLNLSDQEIEKFGQDFSQHCDECLVMTPMGWSRTDLYDFTLGSQPTTGDNGETPLKNNRIVCPYPFYSMAVNFDGTVSVCCADWSHGTVVGDVKEQTLLQIWQGNAMNELRKKHLLGQRSDIDACSNCQTIQGLPMDSDLDDTRNQIIKRLPS